jgi:hypothetical protein
MSAHTGRCFRAWRRTTLRKLKQGTRWEYPIRQKVPLALRPFMAHIEGGRQVRANANVMKLAITKYAQHQAMVGHRTQGR